MWNGSRFSTYLLVLKSLAENDELGVLYNILQVSQIMHESNMTLIVFLDYK